MSCSDRAWVGGVYFWTGHTSFCFRVSFVTENSSGDHKHIPDYSLSVPSFLIQTLFLLQQYNMCLVLADSHVNKKHVQYTLSEQSITVTIIDNDTRLFSARFLRLCFSVVGLCWSQELKGKVILHSDSFQGFEDIWRNPFYYSHCIDVTLNLNIRFFVFFKWAC